MKNFVLVEVDSGEVAQTTCLGSDEVVPIVIDFDYLETEPEEARDVLEILEGIDLPDASGNLLKYKERLGSIVEGNEEEDEEFDEEEDEDPELES